MVHLARGLPEEPLRRARLEKMAALLGERGRSHDTSEYTDFQRFMDELAQVG